MPGRIEIDLEATIFAGLVLVHRCPRSQDGRLGLRDDGDDEIEVELLRMGATRPRRSDEVVNALEREGRATARMVLLEAPTWRLEGGPISIGTVLEAPPEDVPIETGELEGIGAVDDETVEERSDGRWSDVFTHACERRATH